MECVIEAFAGPPPGAQPLEIVERKGLGHPDTICDALAERLSVSLSRFYLDRFGMIHHHNVDKALLWAGASEPAFGGGRVTAPLEIYLAGRATAEVEGIAVPIAELAAEGTRAWFRERFHALDPDRDVKVRCLVRRGSADLVQLFERARRSGVWLANDTSCGVGFAPLTDLERAVLAVERALNDPTEKADAPEVGEDIKVMGLRRQGRVVLTVACAFIGRHLPDLDAYLAAKRRLAERARAAAQKATDMAIEVRVNAADDPAAGNVYLTVTGTSAEGGDDGQAGRGNRANGLITPFRPMTMEAVAGKNPVTHVGKLYNAAAALIAAAAVDGIDEVLDAECHLLSQIGAPVTEPQMALLRVRTGTGAVPPALRARLQAVVRDHVGRIDGLWRRFVAEELPVA